MSFLGLRGGRRVLATAGIGLSVVIACSTPDYVFVDDEVLHCENNATDPELGETDVDCGGADCRGCNYGKGCVASSDCAEGECLDGYCLEAGCENHELDGDETATDCGGNCPGCRDGQPCGVPTDCESNVCSGGTCAAPTCEDEVRNGDELAEDCGGPFCDGCGIGDPCNVAADCQSGSCDGATQTCALNCARGTDECDGDLEEPCETNLLTSDRNCGECGKVCNLSHADASCVGGTCQIDECVAPWIRCNTDESDGCEVNASADVMNCGGCGMVCPDLNGTPSCVNSECVIRCAPGFGDCDENALTGCEAPVNDVDNCGECDRECPPGQGTPYCVEDEDEETGFGCGITICAEEGFGDCDGDQECETNLADDPENCGRCGGACSAPNGSADCVDGKCVIVECDDGWLNCDTDAPDGGVATGCEANVESDPRNCGGCGSRCDVVDNGSGTCQDGSCDLVCDPGYEDCDERVETGCEADTTSDADHCGGCDNDCSIPNASEACVDSACAIDDCLGSFADCNSAAGCETDTATNVQHCGDCGQVCSRAGATGAACSAGRCAAPSCDATHENCDGINDNGCETDVTTTADCGACDNACGSATPSCVESADEYACQARIAIANAPPYPTAQVAGNRLTFNATPHAGNNRVVLLAIASESQNNGFAAARPDSVRFGSQNMIAGPSQAGTNDPWSPDLFVYYLALGDAAAAEAQVTVTIDATVDPTAHGLIAQHLLLTGVRQTNPIAASAGAFVGNPEAPDPSVIELTVPLAVSGSAIYSFASALWIDGGNCPAGTPSGNCPTWSVSPATNLTVTETMSTSPISVFNTPMRAFGMFVSAASPSLPAAGNYLPRWSIPWSGRMTHLAVAIAPAQQ